MGFFRSMENEAARQVVRRGFGDEGDKPPVTLTSAEGEHDRARGWKRAAAPIAFAVMWVAAKAATGAGAATLGALAGPGAIVVGLVAWSAWTDRKDKPQGVAS
jgi:hypothetical protein